MPESSFVRLAGTLALLGVALSAGCSDTPTALQRFGPPTALQIVTGNAQTGEANLVLPIPLTVQVLDAEGRGVPGVTVTWSVRAGGGALLARTFPTVTDSIGLVVVFWQLGSPLTGAQGVVAACCLAPAAIFTAHAELALAQRLSVIGGVWQVDTVGRTLALPLVVQVLRADGTPDAGATVAWSALSRGGQVSPRFARADAAGQATTTWTLGTVAGPETTVALVRGLPPALVFATALPGPPARVAITPSSLPVLGVIGDTVHVSAQAWDRYGNLEINPVQLRARDSTIVGVSGSVVQARHHGTTWIAGGVGVLGDSVQVTVLGFSAVSDGGGHTCALSLAGDAYCWGENYQGSIGDGTRIDRPRPVPIGPGLGLRLPFTDWHTCALTASGQAFCWGLDQSGELGDGSPNYATEVRQVQPVAVAGGHLFTGISAGRSHSCAVEISGDAYCWGDNGIGQLGRDTLTSTCLENGINRCSNWPIPVAGGLKFTRVSAGSWEHSCGVTTSGAAYCWGSNGSSQLGNDSTSDRCGFPIDQGYPCSHIPLRVEGGVVFKSVKAGGYFTCGLSDTGEGYCWGYGVTGDLGNGANVTSTMPVKVSGGLSFTDVQAGRWNACGLTTGGKVYCWGGSYGSTPAPVLANLVFGSLAAGGDGGSARACALTTDNDLYCWYSGAY